MAAKKLSSKDRTALIESSAQYRRQIFKDLLMHLKTGYSLDCFPPLSVISIEKYCKLYKDEFVEEDLIDAIREGKTYWEGLGNRQSNGTCLGNSRAWQYNMINRFGWTDRVDVKADHKVQASVNIVSYASTKQPSQPSESVEST